MARLGKAEPLAPFLVALGPTRNPYGCPYIPSGGKECRLTAAAWSIHPEALSACLMVATG
jgi:hypothetical protein